MANALKCSRLAHGPFLAKKSCEVKVSKLSCRSFTSSGFLAITHYQRLLQYMHPDYIHVLIDGKIVKSGDIELANQLEEKGYSWVRETKVG